MLATTASSWVGSKIGKYSILRELGRGGMGEVYLAEDTLLGREVALKRLLPIFAEDEEFVARFKREARAISRLTHPSIVSIHSLDWINGILVLDMEYVNGTSLMRLFQDSVITPQFTALLAADLLSALVECHEEGIVHRDIKPSNILLTESMQAKLVDFGIATALADSNAAQLREGRSTTVVLGTPRFMAPEAWDGAEVTPAWDMFSLGVVLYECLTGEVAFKGTTTSALAKQITNEPLPKIANRRPDVSVQLAHLVDRLVMIDPAQRCVSAREALSLLDGAPELKASPTTATVRRSTAKTLSRVLGGGFRSLGISGAAGRRRLRQGFVLIAVVAALAGVFAVRDRIGTLLAGSVTSKAPALINVRLEDRFYSALALEGDGDREWHWWITPGNEEGTESLIAYSSMGLMQAQLRSSGDEVEITGEWAGYRSRTTKRFEQGPVTGTGRWQSERASMAVTLSFVSASQRSMNHIGFSVGRDEKTSDRRAFLEGIESAEYLPRLLYFDMVPRSSLLAVRILDLLPSSGEHVRVPLIVNDRAPLMDGRLDDAVWRERIFDSDGRVGEMLASGGQRARLWVRQTQQGLYIGAEIPWEGKAGFSATLGILQGIAQPPQFADRAFFEMDDSGERARHFHVGNTERPFPENWLLETALYNGIRGIEVFIPAVASRELEAYKAVPWRLNLSIWQTMPSATPNLVVQWGDEDVKNLVHGVMLDFNNSKE